MYTALTLRSACSHSSYRLPMSGVEGLSPRVLLGDLKGAILSRERMAPFIRTLCAAAGNPFAPYGATILTTAVYGWYPDPPRLA